MTTALGRRVGLREGAATRSVVSCLVALLSLTTAATAQAPQSIWRPGDAAVTGFPGVIALPVSPPPADPADKTVIDLQGPSFRIYDLSQPGGPPQGQLISAPKIYTATAAQVGTVFAITKDDQLPANVFVAATSNHGLPIVAAAPDPDGTARRLKAGEPGARFMDGLFGPAAQGGGPGSIWRIDGRTGAVSLYANVDSMGLANPGVALGDIVFDPVSRQVFAADRHTGLVHRLDPTGASRGTFDHGTAGRPAGGAAPIAYDPASRVDVQSPGFDPANPATWGYAAPGRRIYGLAVHQRRLFYAVAEGPQIWSVGIGPDGGFGPDARLELAVPPRTTSSSAPPFEISDIAFDGRGRMYLAERADPTGAYDWRVQATPQTARTLRFSPAQFAGAGASRWMQTPEDYAIGFAGVNDDGNGGLALGHGYDRRGRISTSTCGAWLWTTGEQLRNPADPMLAASLQAGGPLAVQGLQGNPIDLVRPQNVPPTTSYFADHDDRFADPDVAGWMDDVEIWQVCGGRAGWTYFGDGYGTDWWREPPTGGVCLAIAVDWSCRRTGAGNVLEMRVLDQSGYGFDTVAVTSTSPGIAMSPAMIPIGPGGGIAANVVGPPGAFVSFEVCAYRETDRLAGGAFPCCKARFDVEIPWGLYCPPTWRPWFDGLPPPRLMRRGSIEAPLSTPVRAGGRS